MSGMVKTESKTNFGDITIELAEVGNAKD